MQQRILLALCLLCLGHSAQSSSSGKEFWLAYMENLNLAFNGNPVFTIIISSEHNTSGQIEIPATGLTIPFTVIANQANEVYLPNSIFYPQGDEAIANVGIKIIANDTIDVYAYHHRNFFSDATMVVPKEELGTDYLIMAKSDDHAVSPSEFVIVATEDSTKIQITPSVTTLTARPAGVPFTIILNKGQVFQLQSMNDLSGTKVSSLNLSKKIAVFGGARQANIRCSTGADSHVYDMNYHAMFGDKFVAIPTLNLGGDLLKIMCEQDSTYISIDNGTPLLLPTKGSYIDTLMSSPAYITSTKPIAVSQFIKGYSCNIGATADPSMLVLTPIKLMRKKANFKSVTSPSSAVALYTPDHFCNIVIRTSQEDSVYLDGNPLTGFQVLSGNPQYSFKQVAIDSNNHTLMYASGFNAYAYGTGFANAYTYHLGFQSTNTPTSIDEIKTSSSVIFPNPMHDFATITLNDNSDYSPHEFRLYTMDGKLVYNTTFYGNQMKLAREHLASGLYFYLIKGAQGLQLKGKISVQ